MSYCGSFDPGMFVALLMSLFHRDRVLKRFFDGLETGSTVSFREEAGEKGAQPSMVRRLRTDPTLALHT